MGREAIRSSEAPPPSGSYSQAIRVRDLLFLAGQGPFDADGTLVGAGSVGAQTRQALANLDAVARAAGGSLRDAVRVGAYLRDLADFEEYDAVYREFFSEPFPARSTIQSDLVGFDIEIDAVVWLGSQVDLTSFETPVATVDLDAVERNIRRVQDYCDEHGLANRPHVKTHKLPALAHMQVAGGAVGITCQKLGEAEVMAAAGIRDILVSFPLVGPAKAERLAALARACTVSVVGDSGDVARDVSDALARDGLEVDFLVECDTGFRRTGVQTPAEAAELAELVASLPGLRFGGLMTYPTLPESGNWFRAARREIEERGLRVDRVSGGGTPGYRSTHEVGEVTEVRCGTYVYGDRGCVVNGVMPLEDCALRVRATVVSRPTRDRAILDVGTKTLTSDAVEADLGGFGHIVEHPETVVYSLHEEHGHVDVSRSPDAFEVGEVVTVIPNHACGCTAMHDEVVAHRGGRVVGVWAVAARGKIRQMVSRFPSCRPSAPDRRAGRARAS